MKTIFNDLFSPASNCPGNSSDAPSRKYIIQADYRGITSSRDFGPTRPETQELQFLNCTTWRPDIPIRSFG